MSPLTPELGKIKPTLLLSPLALMELLAQILSTRHKNVIIATSCSTDQELTHTQLYYGYMTGMRHRPASAWAQLFQFHY